MKKSIFTIIGSAFGALLVGGGATAAVVVPLALKAKEGLENFVIAGKGTPSHSLKGKEEINYVALGDSIAAGYNGFLGTEGNSYPEYVEASLENHGVSVNLENIAVSGYRRGDIIKQMGEPEVIKKLLNADLVTTTIGGNDLLRILQLFDLSYLDFKTLMIEAGTLQLSTTEAFSKYGVQTIENEEIKERLIKSLKMMKEMAAGTIPNSDIFAFDEKISHDNLVASLKKQYMEHAWWVNKLSDATHVYVAAPNPFASYPSDLLNAKNTRMEGDFTVAEYYDHLMGVITSNVTTGYDEKNIGWSHAVQIDSDEYSDLWGEKIRRDWDYAGVYSFTTPQSIYAGDNPYVDGADSMYIKNPLTNVSDIHPSMYGYELMGEAVFDKVAGIAGIDIEEAKIQRSTDYVDGTGEWERTDENPALFNLLDLADPAYVGAETNLKLLDGFNSFLTLDNFAEPGVVFEAEASINQSLSMIEALDASSDSFVNSATESFKSALAGVLLKHLAGSNT